MKKLNSKLYQDNQLNERMHDILGGAENAKCDVEYTDTRIKTTEGIIYDAGTPKVMDVVATQRCSDTK